MISARATKGAVIACILTLLSVAAVAVALHRADLFATSDGSPAPVTAAAAPSSPPGSGFPLLAEPQSVSELQFVNEDDRALTLADFHGKTVLLNIWATWCVPCREEMPALDRLQTELGGPAFEVLALSIDRQGVPEVKKFYEEYDLEALQIYVDASGKAARDLGVVGIPTTLLIDHNGNEIGRMVGPVEWDAPDLLSFFRNQLAVSGPINP